LKLSKLSAAALALSLISNPAFSAEKKLQSATVETALTGDTVRLKGGKILKYIGLDTYSPESKIPQAREYGQRALEFNHQLTAGKKIGIQWGPKLRDKQGKLLGYVWLQDGTFVNEEMLREGWAKAKITVPNIDFADQFRDWEFEAKKSRKGIWLTEVIDPNSLKRFLGDKNTKIYYLPDSPELERIPESYLVEFNSRVDAKAAGYRACFSCRQKGELDEESE
jgi:micrococcal nuclease